METCWSKIGMISSASADVWEYSWRRLGKGKGCFTSRFQNIHYTLKKCIINIEYIYIQCITVLSLFFHTWKNGERTVTTFEQVFCGVYWLLEGGSHNHSKHHVLILKAILSYEHSYLWLFTFMKNSMANMPNSANVKRKTILDLGIWFLSESSFVSPSRSAYLETSKELILCLKYSQLEALKHQKSWY